MSYFNPSISIYQKCRPSSELVPMLMLPSTSKKKLAFTSAYVNGIKRIIQCMFHIYLPPEIRQKFSSHHIITLCSTNTVCNHVIQYKYSI